MYERTLPRRCTGLLSLAFLLTLPTTGALQAQVKPERAPALAEKEYRHPDLDILTAYQPPNELPEQAAAQARRDLADLGIAAEHARVDVRSQRWGSLLAAHPLVPGNGVGNSLRWEDLGTVPPQDTAALEHASWNAFHGFLANHKAQLGIELEELAEQAQMSVGNGGDLVQIHVPRVVDGIRVRSSYLTAVIGHGNLVLFGTHNWGDVKVTGRPQLSADEAFASAAEYLEPLFVSGSWGEPELILLPMARGHNPHEMPVGQGYEYRLAWAVRPQLDGEEGAWEALVDAHSGEVLAFEDTRHYAATHRRVQGGVYPVSNDGQVPDGVEQAGWPMPLDNVTTPSGTVGTDSGGNLPSPVDGTITSSLSGSYVHINDHCGPISLSSSGDLDFGTSTGTDCATPGFGGAGNTHSSRTGFYELNRLGESARARLPSNTWLTQQLTANVNINSSCGAYWNGTVNFFRSSSQCGNPGEIASVYDHEWGHGLDQNDATPGVSYPGEGIADLYAALRLNTSCIGRGFFLSQNCTGYGDPCIDCTGVRDIDYAMRASGLPHTYTWANGSYCSAVHCKGAVYAEAVWDLWKRDLAVVPYSMDDNTALEVVTRMTYLGAGGVGTWFSGGPPWGGCSASGGYLNYLAADDDNGNVGDGTPHMTAIYNAFNRHEIACNTPAVVDSGCAGTPTVAPVVTASAGDRAADLSWSAVSGATKYQVFRTDSVFACAFGKVKVGETTSKSFSDSGLQNGREYSYVVIPIGAADTCIGPASACATVIPREPVLWVDLGGQGDFTDIQSAVDAAQAGDEIRVVQGVYTTASGDVVTWQNKDLTLQGGYESVGGALDSGLYETVIDGGGVAFRSGVFTSGLTAASRLSGFTFLGGQNGHLNSGAGIHNDNSDLVISHCVFHSNYANWGAGVASWNDSDVTITHSYFHDNSAYYGAAIHNGSGSEATIVNSVFYSNSAGYGGAIRNVSSNSTTVNCSFGGNSAAFGKTMNNRLSEPVILNSILWNGGGEISDNDGLVTTVTYSDVQGGFPGTGNIDADPRYFNVAAGNLRLRFLSPAIDAGTCQGAPPDDIEGTSRPQGRRCDMGAYETRKKITPTEL